jgi:hypothetical protein
MVAESYVVIRDSRVGKRLGQMQRESDMAGAVLPRACATALGGHKVFMGKLLEV